MCYPVTGSYNSQKGHNLQVENHCLSRMGTARKEWRENFPHKGGVHHEPGGFLIKNLISCPLLLLCRIHFQLVSKGNTLRSACVCEILGSEK